jgi:predicted small lipoprotein YifL
MHCWARHAFLVLVAVLGVGEMIAACGQKGRLYLPKPEPAKAEPKGAKPTQPASPPAGATSGQATGADRGIGPGAPASAKGSD